MSELVRINSTEQAISTSGLMLSDATKKALAASKAESTRKAYAGDWSIFDSYCHDHGVASLGAQPEVVANFLSWQAEEGVKAATLNRRLAAIAYQHKVSGLPNPTKHEGVREVFGGIKRMVGTRQNPKQALTLDKLYKILAHIDSNTVKGKRDRAVILLAFATACRRSEVVGFDVADMEATGEGLRLLIKHSKTDQQSAGQYVTIPSGGRLGVVDAIADWLCVANIKDGALFRNVNKADKVGGQRLDGKDVARILKHYVSLAGLNPSDFSGHSTRRGFVTEAFAHGADMAKTQQQTRHKSINNLIRYNEDANAFKDHAGASFL